MKHNEKNKNKMMEFIKKKESKKKNAKQNTNKNWNDNQKKKTKNERMVFLFSGKMCGALAFI